MPRVQGEVDVQPGAALWIPGAQVPLLAYPQCCPRLLSGLRVRLQLMPHWLVPGLAPPCRSSLMAHCPEGCSVSLPQGPAWCWGFEALCFPGSCLPSDSLCVSRKETVLFVASESQQSSWTLQFPQTWR